MKLLQITFGSFSTYSPYGTSDIERRSQKLVYQIKQEGFWHTGSRTIPMSEYFAIKIKTEISKMPFNDLFNRDTVLVPAPTSSPIKPKSLWVPKLFATELVKAGLGKDIEPCLERIYSVTKSSTAFSKNMPRPKAIEHYDSMVIKETTCEPSEILVIDDIVTLGATLFACVNKLADAFPNSKIRGFALVRTISNSNEFREIYEPCMGTITLRGDYTFREP